MIGWAIRQSLAAWKLKPMLQTVEAIGEAIGKIPSRIELNLERNRRERLLLDRAKIQTDFLLLMLLQVNTMATSPES